MVLHSRYGFDDTVHWIPSIPLHINDLRDPLLDKEDTLLLDGLQQRRDQLHGVRCENTLLRDGTVEDELDGDSTGDSNELGHGRRTHSGSNGHSIVDESRRVGLLRTYVRQ